MTDCPPVDPIFLSWLSQNVGGLASLLTMVMVLYTLDAFRREHRWKKHIDLAEEALALFYEARDAIKAVRLPVSSSSETAHIERKEGETDDKYNARRDASVVLVRLNQHSELFSKIHALRYRFMAQLGKESGKPFDTLHEIRSQLLWSANVLASRWAERPQFFGGPDAERRRQAYYERTEKIVAIFMDLSTEDEPDPISQKMDALVADLEKICEPIVSSKGTLFSVLNKRLN